MAGGQSRWSRGREAEFVPLEPVLVVEVTYDHLQGARFRHAAGFVRWRTDKAPRDCAFEQLRSPG
jgi:ATP-dependent DNA ligase